MPFKVPHPEASGDTPGAAASTPTERRNAWTDWPNGAPSRASPAFRRRDAHQSASGPLQSAPARHLSVTAGGCRIAQVVTQGVERALQLEQAMLGQRTSLRGIG